MYNNFPKNINLKVKDNNKSVISDRNIMLKPTIITKKVKNELNAHNEVANYNTYNAVHNNNPPVINRFRSQSEVIIKLNRNQNVKNDNYGNIRLTSDKNVFNKYQKEYSPKLEKITSPINILRNNNKNLVSIKNKKVVGYNYYTNRKKELNSFDSNIIQNLPISIYVGTWNCEYTDFSKDNHYEKKRYTTNFIKKNINEEIYKSKINDRYSIRTVTPLVCYNAMNKQDDAFCCKPLSDNNNINHGVSEKCVQSFLKENKDAQNTFSKSKRVIANSYEQHNLLKYKDCNRMDMKTMNKNNNEKNKIMNELYTIFESNEKKKKNDNLQTVTMNNNVDNNIIDLGLSKNLLNQTDSPLNPDFLQVKRNFTQNEFIFSQWIQPYYDIYVICLQESITDNIIEYLSMYLKEVNQETYVYLPLADYKLSGYGDGAFLQMKSTTIAAWIKKNKLYPNGPVKLCASKSIAFNKLNNSKGCVSILLNIFNQFVLFIGCHMPAKDPELRHKSREFLLTKLSEYFSNKTTSNFKDVFHHVIWAGDFNFRVLELNVEKAVYYLQTNNLKEMLKYDEGHSAYSYDLSINFEEPRINFLPTYKKKGGRLPINKNDSKWVEKEYKLMHTIKWYKGGKQETRIPSWTDRIFKWSSEKTKNCLVFVPNSYISPIPEEKSILLASDHNPVSCCFMMYKMKNEENIPITKSIWKF